MASFCYFEIKKCQIFDSFWFLRGIVLFFLFCMTVKWIFKGLPLKIRQDVNFFVLFHDIV